MTIAIYKANKRGGNNTMISAKHKGGKKKQAEKLWGLTKVRLLIELKRHL